MYIDETHIPVLDKRLWKDLYNYGDYLTGRITPVTKGMLWQRLLMKSDNLTILLDIMHNNRHCF